MPKATIDIPKMRQAATQAVAFLRLLANEDRLLLLCQLTRGERCVGELEQLLGIRQPTLSQQLGVLRTDGLVSTRREGKNIYYRLADAKVQSTLAQLYELFCAR
ncbi:MAG: transcriptional regulator [Gammaproteobacteria bacterium]|nr:transcriptional regulator [Gammaproteobacteria bacterium]